MNRKPTPLAATPFTGALLAAVLALSPLPAQAELSEPETTLQLGISDVPKTPNTPFALLTHRRPQTGLPLGLDFVAASLGSIAGRSTSEPGSRERVNFVSLQLGYQLGRFSLASGLAAVSHTTVSLSSGYQFHSHLGIRLWRAAELGLGHLSNAGLRSPNRGESYIAIGFRF